MSEKQQEEEILEEELVVTGPTKVWPEFYEQYLADGEYKN